MFDGFPSHNVSKCVVSEPLDPEQVAHSLVQGEGAPNERHIISIKEDSLVTLYRNVGWKVRRTWVFGASINVDSFELDDTALRVRKVPVLNLDLAERKRHFEKLPLSLYFTNVAVVFLKASER